MTSKDYAIIGLLILVLLLGSGLYYFWTQSRDVEAETIKIKNLWNVDKGIHAKENAARDSFEVAQAIDREADTKRHALETARLTGDLKALKRRERNSRPDTVLKTLTDTIYLTYDTLVAELKNERDSLKISFTASIDTLKAMVATQKGQIDLADSLINSVKVVKPSLISFGTSVGPALVVGPDGKIYGGLGSTIGLNIKIPLKKSLRKLFSRTKALNP